MGSHQVPSDREHRRRYLRHTRKEVSYYWVDDIRDHLSILDVLDVKVLEVDRENRRIVVSLHALQPDPWEDDPQRLPYADQRVLGTIATITSARDNARLSLRTNIEPGFVY